MIENNSTDIEKIDSLENHLLQKEEFEKMNLFDVTKLSLYLGFISFGGPIAHIGIFKKILIEENKFLTDEEFTNLFNICNVIPGPSSSQLLTAIMTIKAKSVLAGIISFLCFNMPSLIVMIFLANFFKNSFKIEQYSTMTPALFSYEYLIFLFFMGVCQSAVANIFQAALTLSEKIKNNKLQLFLMIKSGLIFLYTGDHISMIFIMLISGTITIFRNDDKMLLSIGDKKKNFNNNPWFLGFPALFLWVISLSVIIFYKFYFSDLIGKNFNLLLSFFRIGSLIVGGGHVVIPMMITEFVNTNLISQNDVLNGFSLVSLLPGPMFNIAGYIGTNVNGTFAGFLSAFSIFLPGMLFMFFIIGKLDFLYSKEKLQYFIRGASTAAIGFIFSSAIMIFYETTFKNGQSNFITGSFNIAFCFYLLKYTKIILPFVLFIGGFNFILFRFILFILIK